MTSDAEEDIHVSATLRDVNTVALTVVRGLETANKQYSTCTKWPTMSMCTDMHY